MTSLLKNVEGLFRGLLVEYAPGMVKGALLQMLTKASVCDAVKWVQDDYILLDNIPGKFREELSALKLGKMAWLNAEWAIEALKDDKPQLASLFLSWDKGHDWLERQCVHIKKSLQKEDK